MLSFCLQILVFAALYIIFWSAKGNEELWRRSLLQRTWAYTPLGDEEAMKSSVDEE